MDKSDTQKKWTWSVRLTKEQSDGLLREMYNKLVLHIGKPILFFKKERRREMIPVLVYPISNWGNMGINANYYIYNNKGEITDTISYTIGITNLLTREQKVYFFDDDI